MTAEIEGFSPEMIEALSADAEKLDALADLNPYDAGFEDAAKLAIDFAEQLAPGRNGGKRMREFFEAYRAAAKG